MTLAGPKKTRRKKKDQTEQKEENTRDVLEIVRKGARKKYPKQDGDIVVKFLFESEETTGQRLSRFRVNWIKNGSFLFSVFVVTKNDEIIKI